MSSKKVKEAYLRKHNLTPRGPRPSSEELDLPEPASPRSPGRTEGATPSKSWAAKRKEHVLARAGLARPATQADVAVTAVQFAVKLRMRTAAKDPNEKSWQQRRREVFLATHAAKPPDAQVRVAAKSLMFANRMLKSLRKGQPTGESDEQLDPELAALGAGGSSSPRARPASAAKEKTWTQLRKESYLKRYGRQLKQPQGPLPSTQAANPCALPRLSPLLLPCAF
jgi:hypothetical protein